MTVTARAIGAVVSLSALALLLAAVRGGAHRPEAYHIAWVAMSVIAASLSVMVAAPAPGRPRQEEPDSCRVTDGSPCDSTPKAPGPDNSPRPAR